MHLLRYLFLFFFVSTALQAKSQTVCDLESRAKLEATLEKFSNSASSELAAGDLVLAVGKSFLGTPYLEKTLEIPGKEQVVINLMGLDCTTFVESVLALVYSLKKTSPQMADMETVARGLDMAVLVEVHDQHEMDRALKLKTPLLGVNNRNLRTFEVSLQTTLDLLGALPAGRILVTESGIQTREDVLRLRQAGVQAFLVGEAFMRQPEPGLALAELFQA